MSPTHRRPPKAPQDEVGRVVLRAMGMVAEPGQMTPATSTPDPEHVQLMAQAVLGAGEHGLREAVEEICARGVTPLQVAELYVPAVAHFLGRGWVCDELDFAAVTIGAARLQSMLRHLAFQPHATPRTVAFLVGVPQGVQHTLGASVLAAQLRHRGYSVHLDLTLTPDRLTEQMRKQHYAGVLLSASGAAHLESCRKLVNCSKQESRNTPVLLGGTLLEQVQDIKTRTGSDFVTSDVSEALVYCGQPASQVAPIEASLEAEQDAGA